MINQANEIMNLIMNDIFGFGNLRKLSHNLAENSADLHFFHLLKIVAKFRRKFFSTEHENDKFAEKRVL